MADDDYAPDEPLRLKALTLHQPWASLVACGAKTVETRSWSTKYRGPLAIHAGARQVHIGNFLLLARIAKTTGLIDAETEQDFRALAVPFGAVVAVSTLVDVVPIIDPDECGWHHKHPRGVGPVAHAAIDGQVIIHRPDAPMHTTVLVEQAFGDYTPGRFAWILEKVVEIEPVPAHGKQQLWPWTLPELAHSAEFGGS